MSQQKAGRGVLVAKPDLLTRVGQAGWMMVTLVASIGFLVLGVQAVALQRPAAIYGLPFAFFMLRFRKAVRYPFSFELNGYVLSHRALSGSGSVNLSEPLSVNNGDFGFNLIGGRKTKISLDQFWGGNARFDTRAFASNREFERALTALVSRADIRGGREILAAAGVAIPTDSH